MKKFLSLVLALVMTMSLVTISAGAKDFTDADKVNYDEAIAVISAIGVVDGYTDGSFNPQGTLTRGAAAKIICNLVLGPTTASELSADTAPFKDVPVDHTFAGYIAYCAKEGIIDGYTDGTFRPAAPLTGYAFMKLLLGALGYDKDIEGYNGPNWSINVAKQALGIGLNKGLKDTFNGVKTVTREEACLYALNTLKATMVEYDSKITANVNGATVTIGNSVAQDVSWGTATLQDGNIKNDGYVQFAEKYFTKLELQTGNGIYGRPANTWKLKKAEIGTFTSIAPTYVYTEKTKTADIYKDLGKIVCDEDEYTWEGYVNGKEVNDVYVPVAKPADAHKYYDYAGNGTVTEIYVEDALRSRDQGKVTVVEINNYLGEVSKVKTKDDETTITVKPLSTEGRMLDNKTFVADNFEEEDYVVFTIDWDDDEDEYVIGEVIEPDTVTADVTRVENDKESDDTYLRTSEGKYTYAAATHNVYDLDENTAKHPDLDTEYTLYLDPNGYVLGFKAGEEETKYLYVDDSDEELKDWVAKVILTDASEEKVELKDELKKTPDNFPGGDEVNWIDARGNVTTTKEMTNVDGRIWKYSASDKGVYTLTWADCKELNNAQIKKGKAYVSNGVNEFIVDSKTVFVDVDGEKTYTGYKNVPNIDDADLHYVLDKNGKVAEVVYIFDGDIYDDGNLYFMLADDDRETFKYDDDYYWEFSKAYVNGEKTKLNVRYDALNNDEDMPEVEHLYQIKKTIEGGEYITKIIDVDLESRLQEINAVASGTFWLTEDEIAAVKYDTDDDTIFVTVEYDADGDLDRISEGSMRDMKEDDEVVENSDDEEVTMHTMAAVIKKDENTAEIVYIVRMPMVEQEVGAEMTVEEIEAIIDAYEVPEDSGCTVEVDADNNQVTVTLPDADTVPSRTGLRALLTDLLAVDENDVNANTVRVSVGDQSFTLTDPAQLTANFQARLFAAMDLNEAGDSADVSVSVKNTATRATVDYVITVAIAEA